MARFSFKAIAEENGVSIEMVKKINSLITSNWSSWEGDLYSIQAKYRGESMHIPRSTRRGELIASVIKKMKEIDKNSKIQKNDTPPCV